MTLPPSEEEKAVVENEVNEVREFVSTLKMEDLKEGAWFEKLLIHALSTYSKKVDAEYFRLKYPDLPVDAVVQERIELAARYASIEGALTSAAYSGAIAATIGSGGGASPLSLPAAGATFVVDLTYLSQAQIKLAYDISVLYQVPLDLENPDDLWKLVRIAFSIKIGEGAGLAAVKGVPAVIRPVLKKYYARGVLASAKALPVIGKHLLQRNVIKFAIPVVSVPAATAVNFYTTKTTGIQARNLMRMEAKLAEAASRIAEDNEQMDGTLWAMWITMNATGSTTEDQRTLLHHVTAHARLCGVQEDELAKLRNTVEIDQVETWERLASIENISPVFEAALIAACVSGRPSDDAIKVLEKLAELHSIDFDQVTLDQTVDDWKSPFAKNKRRYRILRRKKRQKPNTAEFANTGRSAGSDHRNELPRPEILRIKPKD